jgi:hypothetical protein
MTICVSCATADDAKVERILEALRRRGLAVFPPLRGGERYGDLGRSRIQSCEALLLLLDPRSGSALAAEYDVQLARSNQKPAVALLLGQGPTSRLPADLGPDDLVQWSEDAPNETLDRVVSKLRERGVAFPEAAGSMPRAGDSSALAVPGPYDVFISYRRDTGSVVGRLLYAYLEKRGKRPFLDVEDLGPGSFDEALFRRIEEAPGFVIVLTGDALDRCHDPRDYVRMEIRHAMETGRRVVPFFMTGKGGFVPPEGPDFPEEVEWVIRQNGVSYSHVEFDGAMDRLVRFLEAAPGAPERRGGETPAQLAGARTDATSRASTVPLEQEVTTEIDFLLARAEGPEGVWRALALADGETVTMPRGGALRCFVRTPDQTAVALMVRSAGNDGSWGPMQLISGRTAAAIPVSKDRWKALPPGNALMEETPDSTPAWEVGILAFPISREPDSEVEPQWTADEVMQIAADATTEDVSPLSLEWVQGQFLGLDGGAEAWSMQGTGAIVHWTRVVFE